MQQRERNGYCFDVDDGATYGGAATGVDIVVVEVYVVERVVIVLVL